MNKLFVEFSILHTSFLLLLSIICVKFKSLLKAILLKVQSSNEATYIPESSLFVKGCGTGGISSLSFKVISE